LQVTGRRVRVLRVQVHVVVFGHRSAPPLAGEGPTTSAASPGCESMLAPNDPGSQWLNLRTRTGKAI
jgi:hypothetical protein